MLEFCSRVLDRTPDLRRNSPQCTDQCRPVVDWAQSYFINCQEPENKGLGGLQLALLYLREFSSPDDYLKKGFSSNNRKAILKAKERGWTARRLTVEEWNVHLQDIHDINTSAPERQGGPMAPDYMEPVKPVVEDDCSLHGRSYFAAFDPAAMIAGYMIGQQCGEIMGGHRFLGHARRFNEADFMRLLWFEMVADLIREHSEIQWAWYHLYDVGNPGLMHWKQSVGLRPYSVA